MSEGICNTLRITNLQPQARACVALVVHRHNACQVTAESPVTCHAYLELLDDVLSILKLLEQGTAGDLLAGGLCHTAVSQRPMHCDFSLSV